VARPRIVCPAALCGAAKNCERSRINPPLDSKNELRVSASFAEAELGDIMPLAFALASIGLLAVATLDSIALGFLFGG
jgi:hypothetical protein